MKKETFYTLALTILFVLILFVFTVSGCKKELTAKKTTLSANDSTAMVTTVTGGYYNFVAAGTGGNIYLLRGYTDTIYKVDATGSKTTFYVPPAPTQADTANYMLNCLTTDSAGNVYTLSFSALTAKIIKINTSGVASTYIDNLDSYNNAGAYAEIKIDNTGNIYFSNYGGVFKITSAGVVSQITALQVVITLDNAGNIIVPYNNAIRKLSATGTLSIIAGTGLYGDVDGPAATAAFTNIQSITCDNKGNTYVAESSNDGTINQIRVISGTGTVSTLLSNPNGHLDGNVSTAKIVTPACLAADAAANLYITEGTFVPGTVNDVRKITF
jgi:hypothetical protein